MGSGDMDIDMEALHKKYSRPREELVAEAQAKFGPGGITGAKAAADVKLAKEVIICSSCQAAGTLKKQYGYRVIDEVCADCDGDGCYVKGEKRAGMELREKVAQVERLVAACEDLDELEALDAALQTRTIKALDEVLTATRKQVLARAEAARATDAAASAQDSAGDGAVVPDSAADAASDAASAPAPDAAAVEVQ